MFIFTNLKNIVISLNFNEQTKQIEKFHNIFSGLTSFEKPSLFVKENRLFINLF